MNDKRDYVEQLFIESGIKKHLWFTKLGYYKLYGEARYLYSFIFQVLMAISLVIGVGNLIQMAFFDHGGLTERILFIFSASALCGGLSDFLLGNYPQSVKYFLAAAIMIYAFVL